MLKKNTVVFPNGSLEMSVNLQACDNYSNLDSTRGRPHWIDQKDVSKWMLQFAFAEDLCHFVRWVTLSWLCCCVGLGCKASGMFEEHCISQAGGSKTANFMSWWRPWPCHWEQPTWKYFTLLTLEHPQSLSLLPSSIVCDPVAEPPVTTHHHHDAESRNDEEAGSGRRLGDPLDEPI